MSGRIRTIKPELLEDAITAGLSDMSFRLFIACILLADDYGNLRFEPEWIRGQVYWCRKADSEQFSAAMDDLAVVVTAYEVKGQRYGAIKNWAKHQRVSHPGKPRVPGLADALPRLSGEPLETRVPDLRSPITDHRSPTTTGNPPPLVRESVPEPSADPTEQPPWFGMAIETVEGSTGEKLRPADSWLRYSGHRIGKGLPRTQQDAVYWLTTVMVPEARKERQAAADKRERDAKWDKDRERQRDAAGAAQPYHKPYKPPPTETRASPKEQADAMKKLTETMFSVGKTGS